MNRFKNILFIADRPDGLTDALNRAVALSQSNDARLTVMDVIPDAGVADYIKRTYAIDLNTALREQRLQALEELTKPLADAAVPVYATVTTGILFIEVIRAVQRNAYDLVIKVAQQDTRLSRALFGSSDMHLLRKCPCPPGLTDWATGSATDGCSLQWIPLMMSPVTYSG